jgi:hypothetical protein
MKEKTIKLLQGNILIDEYLKLCENESFAFLQGLVKNGEMTNRVINEGVIAIETVPYVAKEVIPAIYNKGRLSEKVDCFAEIVRLMEQAFPYETFEINRCLLNAFQFILINTPQYIGGIEAEKVLYDIYKSISAPNTISGKNEYKRIVGGTFKCKRNKFPKWIQEPEWPIVDGKATMFIDEYWDVEDRKHYCFLNEENNCIVEIVQFH